MLTEKDKSALATIGALRDGMIPIPGGEFAYCVIPSLTPWGTERVVTFDRQQATFTQEYQNSDGSQYRQTFAYRPMNVDEYETWLEGLKASQLENQNHLRSILGQRGLERAKASGFQ